MIQRNPIIFEAVILLGRGGLIVFPTDTLYGLAADTADENAVKRIFTLKNRAFSKGLPVMISHKEFIYNIAEDIKDYTLKLMEKYWPGALTLVVKKNPNIPDFVTGDSPNVAVRIPNHPLALELLAAYGKPLAVTSANISGESGAENFAGVSSYFSGKVNLIIPGELTHRTPSTVIDCTGTTPVILRPGAIKI